MTVSSDNSEPMKKQKCFKFEKEKIVKSKIMGFLRDENGLTIVEYAVAAALIVLGVAAAFFTLGNTVDGVITALDAAITAP